MVNLIGTSRPPSGSRRSRAPTSTCTASRPRPGRKLGHVTVTADSAARRDDLLAHVLAIVESTEG